jgi:glycosyltransferase involved in cell wall biosynthesis
MAKLSIVVPVYFNELNLPTTIPALLGLEKEMGSDKLELVFVDDGSEDQSLKLLKEFQEKHPEKIVILQLSRNFGSMAAIHAGLERATGDCIAMISADLQDDPKLLLQMFDYWKKGIKVCYAVRASRQDSQSEKMFSTVFYYLVRKYAISKYPNGGFDFFLIDQEVAKKLCKLKENHTNIMVLLFWMGYPSIQIPYERKSRDKGVSRWTLAKKFKLFIDTFVGFSYMPIRAMSILGVSYSIFAFLYALFLILRWVAFGSEVGGWTTIMVFLSFSFGIVLTMLGVLGEYIWRISDTVRNRPLYVINQEIKPTRHRDE